MADLELPAAIELLPDAQGGWWSNFGSLEMGTPLRRIVTPRGTQALAHLPDGYVVADDARTQLMTWRNGRLLRIGVGPARILAIAGSLLAWSDDAGSVVHLANLDTGKTIDVATGMYALTARVSPDGSSIAVLVSAARDAVVLADTHTGQVITRIVASTTGRWVSAPDDVPPAFLPVPFSWDTAGDRLLLVGSSPAPRVLQWIDGRAGAVTSSFEAPSELEQVVLLER